MEAAELLSSKACSARWAVSLGVDPAGFTSGFKQPPEVVRRDHVGRSLLDPFADARPDGLTHAFA